MCVVMYICGDCANQLLGTYSVHYADKIAVNSLRYNADMPVLRP